MQEMKKALKRAVALMLSVMLMLAYAPFVVSAAEPGRAFAYEPYAINVKKAVVGEITEDVIFTYELKQAGGENVVRKKLTVKAGTSPSAFSVLFDGEDFDYLGGAGNYELREVECSLQGLSVDDAVKTITVKALTDDDNLLWHEPGYAENPLGSGNYYSAIVFGDWTVGNADVESGLAVGGDFIWNNKARAGSDVYSTHKWYKDVGYPIGMPASDVGDSITPHNPRLIVGGNITTPGEPTAFDDYTPTGGTRITVFGGNVMVSAETEIDEDVDIVTRQYKGTGTYIGQQVGGDDDPATHQARLDYYNANFPKDEIDSIEKSSKVSGFFEEAYASLNALSQSIYNLGQKSGDISKALSALNVSEAEVVVLTDMAQLVNIDWNANKPEDVSTGFTHPGNDPIFHYNGTADFRTPFYKQFPDGAIGDNVKVIVYNANIPDGKTVGSPYFPAELKAFSGVVLINVLGGNTVTFTGEPVFGAGGYDGMGQFGFYRTLRDRFIWNFPLTGNEDVKGSILSSLTNIIGSVLAPNADFGNSANLATGNVSGVLIANSLSAGEGWETHATTVKGRDDPDPPRVLGNVEFTSYVESLPPIKTHEVIAGTKVVLPSGREVSADDKVTFLLTPINASGEPIGEALRNEVDLSGGNRDIVFSNAEIEAKYNSIFTGAGDYRFLLREEQSDPGVWEYGATEYVVVVNVAQVGDSFKVMSVAFYLDGTNVDEIEFTNTYLPEPQVRIPGSKTVQVNGAGGAPDVEFEFVLTQVDALKASVAEPIVRNAKARNGETFEFYIESGLEVGNTYYFRIDELDKSTEGDGWVYDATPRYVAVEIAADGDPVITYEAPGSEFVNEYTPPVVPPEEPELNGFDLYKVDENDQPLAGVVFTLNGNPITTNGEGIINIDPSVLYAEGPNTITETIPLEGYEGIVGSISFTVTTSGSSLTVAPVGDLPEGVTLYGNEEDGYRIKAVNTLEDTPPPTT
ncbi:MAG: choice-of-anchor A family protein, partial [Clostridiales bacterium]|nr:choice-of-anchor A family protein [Clostridiales bacterium]